MVVLKLHTQFVLTFLLALSHSAFAAVSSVEDLTGSKLPNGRAVLPAAGAPNAPNGTLFKIASNSLSAFPSSPDGKPLSAAEAFAKIRDAKSADLQFLADKSGSLWALSGNITEVPGVLFLADVAGKKLDEPGPIPKTTVSPAGQYNNVTEGAVYLLKTTDNRYALLRVLEKSPSALVIQYILQPDGGLTFDIPLNTVLPYQRTAETPAPATPAPTSLLALAPTTPTAPPIDLTSMPPLPPSPAAPISLPPNPKPTLGPGDIVEPGRIVLISGSQSVPGIVPSLDTFNRQRTQMLQHDLALIAAPARTDIDKDHKTQAINELLYLHADEPEVADLLVANISFLSNSSTVHEFSRDAFHPCFSVLKRLGTSAVSASLKALRTLDLDAPGEGTDSPAYKADLLARVIRANLGDDVAEFIFHREAQKDPNPKPRAVFEYILEKR